MSGALTLMLAGASTGPAVQLRNDTAYDGVTSPADASASWFANNTGTVSGSNISTYNWLNSGANTDYEIRATIVTGTVSAGSAATGSWLSLGTTRFWNKTRSLDAAGISQVDLTIEIRRVSDSVVLATASVSLEAEVL